MSALQAIQLITFINRNELNPETIVNFSKIDPSIPKLLGSHVFPLQLFFEDGLKFWKAPLPQILQFTSIFTRFKSKSRDVTKRAFQLRYYDLYESLAAAGIGKFSDEQLLQYLLEDCDSDTYQRFNGPQLYEDYLVTHTMEEMEALRLRNKL